MEMKMVKELLLQALEHEMGGVKVYETALKCVQNEDLKEEWEKYLEETEKQQIERSLRFHGGNRTRAAKELRISRATLINKIKRYGITE